MANIKDWVLPDCMMPDGGDPCAGFQQIYAEHARLNAENLMLRSLVKVMLDNDPDEPIADNGVTVLDGWRNDARRILNQV